MSTPLIFSSLLACCFHKITWICKFSSILNKMMAFVIHFSPLVWVWPEKNLWLDQSRPEWLIPFRTCKKKRVQGKLRCLCDFYKFSEKKYIKKMQENLKLSSTRTHRQCRVGPNSLFFLYLDGGDVLDSEFSNFYVFQMSNN